LPLKSSIPSSLPLLFSSASSTPSLSVLLLCTLYRATLR
jgi:hypothetical protein